MTGSSVTVDVLCAGEVTLPVAYTLRPAGRPRLASAVGMLLPGSEKLRAPLLAFVVRHPSAGAILVDTGLHPLALQSPAAEFGQLLARLFRPVEPATESFGEQLHAAGVDPEDVELVVMTHLHPDHTSGMRLLPRAQFICERREWEAANRRSARTGGYVAHHLPDRSRMRLVDFDREGEPYEDFGATIDLLGDGSIRLLSTPGHTPGHLSLLLRTAGGEVLLAGDAGYTRRNLDEQRLPLLTADDEQSRRSLAELARYAGSRSDVTVVPTHDPSAWRELVAA